MAKEDLQERIKKMRREYDCVADLSNTPKIFPHVSSGSLVIDLLSGIGGFPVGRISEISGEFSTGKTTIALQAGARIQKEGKIFLLADFEQALDINYAKTLGVDVTPVEEGGKFILLTPDSLEDGWSAIHYLLESPEIGMIAIDSVTAMIPKDTFNEKFEQDARIARQAQLLSPHWRQLVEECKRINCTALVLNQLRTKFEQKFGTIRTYKETSGGEALKFFSSIRIAMEVIKKVEGHTLHDVTQMEIKSKVASKIKVDFIKNKMATPYKRGEFYVRYGMGIDNLSSLIDVAIERDIIKQTGSFYAIPLENGEVYKLNGMEQIWECLAADREKRLYLVTLVGWDTILFE